MQRCTAAHTLIVFIRRDISIHHVIVSQAASRRENCCERLPFALLSPPAACLLVLVRIAASPRPPRKRCARGRAVKYLRRARCSNVHTVRRRLKGNLSFVLRPCAAAEKEMYSGAAPLGQGKGPGRPISVAAAARAGVPLRRRVVVRAASSAEELVGWWMSTATHCGTVLGVMSLQHEVSVLRGAVSLVHCARTHTCQPECARLPVCPHPCSSR